MSTGHMVKILKIVPGPPLSSVVEESGVWKQLVFTLHWTTGPVDNRPSINWFHHFVKEERRRKNKEKMTCDP